jgi:hypothetical protein
MDPLEELDVRRHAGHSGKRVDDDAVASGSGERELLLNATVPGDRSAARPTSDLF